MRWRLNELAALEWRLLGDEWLVFNAGSGLTHAMDPARAALLHCLELQEHDAESLCSVLREEYGLDLTEAGGVQQFLDEMVSQGLIEPVTR